jgi:hypothetical protein
MPKMKTGDVRLFEGKKRALAVSIGLWAEKPGRQIHIHISGHGGNTWVTNDPKSERYHKTLFRNLRQILLQNERWPFGDEGDETEAK